MKIKIIISILLLLLFMTSCGKKFDSKGIILGLDIFPETITDFLFVKMNYSFKFSDEFTTLDKDYRIFVHFWRMMNREMLLQDDHLPLESSLTWKKGEDLKYSRIIFIPKFIDEIDVDFKGYEEVKLTVGLYEPGGKEDKIVLFQKVLNVQSASLNAPYIDYTEGWNVLETNLKIKSPGQRKWRWTTKRSVCTIENPQEEADLIIRGGVDKLKFQNQKVIIKINDKLVDEFIPKTAKFTKKYKISPELMGNEDEFQLIFETNKTFVPSRLDAQVKDNRELGIQIYFLYFRKSLK